jgi:DHA2 family multidrug resistance protein
MGALNGVSVEGSGEVGKLAGLLQHHALKRDGFFVEGEVCARQQQALVMGFSDTFAVIGVVLVLAAIAVAFTRKVKASGAAAH